MEKLCLDVANEGDLCALAELYAYLSDAPVYAEPLALQALQAILANPDYALLVCRAGERLAGCATVYRLPSMTHGARPFAVVEHVVTAPDYQGRGCASTLLRRALQWAREQGCYKAMLITGRRDAHVHRLYQKAGFTQDGFTAYTVYLDEQEC